MRIEDLEGNIIFESNHNTIKETAEAAVRRGISLAKADLRYADLTEPESCHNQLELEFFRRTSCV